MKTHPEQRDDEIYLGNSTPVGIFKSSWRTSRLGISPLKADGTPYTGGDLLPWFIRRVEVQAAIKSEKLNPNFWSESRIRVFNEMLE